MGQEVIDFLSFAVHEEQSEFFNEKSDFLCDQRLTFLRFRCDDLYDL